ncbi:beta strand repeat-containing protein [Rhodohalobacter sp.]|uniref:beta strand repeat-containing protein n=1 Tax=Rhodohalobacter sp. TaxID=1974210 RepID=UPI002ACE54B1|nr:invasin domain 3-containing protein [Rhodohalobacter sp.]MDZ7755149.1 invasin domain 3-containing protein [Rhodohalobacter sp.]
MQSGGVDADNSTVTADPATLQAGNASTVTIDLRDGSNNPVSGLAETDFTIGLTGSATAGAVSEPTSDGTYSFAVNNTVAESVTVSVAANGVTLTDSPSITFTAADAASLEIQSGNNQTETVSEALADPFVVQISDEFGNPVAGETVDFAIDQVPTGASGQSVSQASILTDAAGQASTLLTVGDTPGTYTVDASSGALTPVTFTAEAQIGGASQMTVTTQPSETTAGEDITPAPAVTVTDDVGNGVQGINVTVSERGGYTFDGGTLTVSTDGSGNASFTDLMIETANTYQLVFNADAAGVPNAGSVEFDVIAAAGNASNTTADVPNGAAGEPTDITITVLDSFNNQVIGTGSNLSASVTNGPNSGATFTSITDNLDGSYSTSYTPETIGTDDITITLNTIEISGSPYSSDVTTSDVSASNSTVTANPTTLQAGTNSEVTVEVRDGSDNPITGLVSSDFNISVSNSGTAGTITETATGGTYTFDVANTVAEEVTVTVTATGTTLDNTPVINFTAADPDLMVITTQPETSVAGQLIEGPPAVRIDDEFDNPVPGISVTVTEQGGASFTTGSTTTVNTNAFGFATFDNLSIETVDQYNLVFAATSVTNQTSNAFTVDPAGVSASASSATATSPHTADGSDASTVTVTLTDGFGNEISGLVDGDFTVDVGVNATAGTVSETVTEGTYEFTVTNTTVETVTVVITADGVTLDDQPTIDFQAGAASEMSITQQPIVNHSRRSDCSWRRRLR